MNIDTYLNTNNIYFLKNEPLSKHTYYKIGGKTNLFIQPKNIDELKQAINKLIDQNIQYYVLGSGANVLFNDNGYEGAIINLEKFKELRIIEDKMVLAQSGINLQDFVDFCILNNLSGYAELSGIPGTIGGALKMNAGAFGVEIYNHLESITILKQDGKLIIKNKNELKSSYRATNVEEGEIIIEATFKLFPGNQAELEKIKEDIINKRHEKQPWQFPSCGSVFKKASLIPQIKSCPLEIEITDNFREWNGIPAGVLIEAVGLKGLKHNDAQISEKHANFIINNGQAKAEDILWIMNKARKEVYTKTGYILEPEVQLINLELEKILV